MEYFDPDRTETAVGMAHSPYVSELLERLPGALDYVEIPFEQLRHAPDTADIQQRIPLVLHCASMSVGGFVPPEESTLAAVEHWRQRTRTPWIGEHLAYIRAEAAGPDDADRREDADPTSLTYTVCPQLSEQSLEQVLDNLKPLQDRYPVPIILENPPQYFPVPGSTMSLVEFTRRLCDRNDRLDLLLDLTHFLISAINLGFDAARELERLPLERVVEFHLSGLKTQSGTAWDDHARPAPEPVFELLSRALRRARPRAVTFEYNWAPDLPELGPLQQQLRRVRDLVGT
ncbi:DUF692 family multinuclear iron-containing protein [Kitasatospora sp. NPDC005856]|uniref:multinuclear non-heme iron-dependent oxidative enzyme ApyH n=1 Tax=Kitasatospora sp. NPDC005856 TaxID=3154566 RepID=UPI0033FA4028